MKSNKKAVRVSRGIAAILATVMVLGCTACGDEADKSRQSTTGNTEDLYYNETGYPICDEPITLTMMCVASGNTDMDSRIMVEELEKRLGIKLEVTSYTTSEEFITQLSLAMAKDELPDLIGSSGNLTTSQLLEYAADGFVLDLSPYLDLMPNFQAVMEENTDYGKYLTAEDGSIYGFNKLETNVFGRVDRVYINNKWLENVDMKMPTNVDELYQVLCAFRDQDANGNGDTTDEIPFDFISNYNDEHMLLAAFGMLTNDAHYILADDGSGKVEFMNTSENYKAYLEYMKNLYEEGLIHKECYSRTNNERKESVAKDTSGFFAASAPFAWGGFDISYDAGFSWVAGLTSEYNDESIVPMTGTVSGGVRLFASAETEYPEAVARFIDYWYTEEGEIAFQRGWEGVTMEYVYNEVLDGDIATLYCPEGYTSTEDYKINKALISGPFDLCSRTYGTQYRLLRTADDDAIFNDPDVVGGYGWAVLVERRLRDENVVLKTVFPTLNYTTDESSARVSLYNDLTSYIATQKAEFITNPAVDIDAEWDNYVKQLETIGLSKMLKIEQAAYDRYNKN